MAIVICHSPKGGVGTTLVAAHLARFHAEADADVCLLSTGTHDSPALHFGKVPSLALPGLVDRPALRPPATVDLRRHRAGADDPGLPDLLRTLRFTRTDAERLLIVDIGAGRHAPAILLRPLATLRLCVLSPAPDSLALLPEMLAESDARRDLFVLNGLDETRRIERHGAALARELLGDRLLGRVRRDVSVLEAIGSLQPLSVHAPASTALADLRVLADKVADRLRDASREMQPLPAAAIRAA